MSLLWDYLLTHADASIPLAEILPPQFSEAPTELAALAAKALGSLQSVVGRIDPANLASWTIEQYGPPSWQRRVDPTISRQLQRVLEPHT